MKKLLAFLLFSSCAYAQQSGLPSPGGVWQHEGTTISGTLAEEYGATEPSLLYEGSPQLLTGTSGSVFKMWWTCGWSSVGLCYAESVDGETWKRATSPVIARSTTGPSHGQVFHYGSTYYYYAANLPNAGTAFDRYESANGYTGWTLTHAGVIPNGTGWESGPLGNIYVLPSAGTWLAMYEAYGASTKGQMGVASSADQGVTWTKYGGNPVISVNSGANQAGGPEVHLINGVYYAWGQCTVLPATGFYPDDMCRWHSPTFLSNSWTVDNGGAAVFSRASVDEGQANPIGQVADPSMVEVNGSIYMAYEGVLAQDGSTPDAFHLKLATAPYTFANLVQTNEGNATSFRSSGGFNNLNLSTCVYWNNNFNQVPCANSTGQFSIGTLDLQGGGSVPSIGQNLYYDGGAGRYIVNGAASFFGTDLAGGRSAFFVYPNGTANAVLGTGVQVWSATTSGLQLPYLTTTPSTSPICPNGTGGTLTTSGCSSGATATIVASSETVTFSATPTFSVATNVSEITMTGNITSFTMAAGTTGQTKTLTFCQDGTGGRTVVAPANVHAFFTVGATASKCNTQIFHYSTAQTAWLADSLGVINE